MVARFWSCAVVWMTVGLALPPARASEDFLGFDFRLYWSNRFNWKANFLNTEGAVSSYRIAGPGGMGVTLEVEDPLNLRFDKDELGYSTLLSLGADLRFGSATWLHLTVDSGELKFAPLVRYSPAPDCRRNSSDPRCTVTSNGRAIGDEARASGFVREAFLDLRFGLDDWLSFKAGKMLLSTGNGFVMDNYALGLHATTDLDVGYGLPGKVSADVLFPDGSFSEVGKRSPFLYLDGAYLLSFFEEVGLFFAWYHDGDDSLASILSSVLSEATLHAGGQGEVLYLLLNSPTTQFTTRGDLFWIGLRSNLAFRRASLTATAILEFGTFDYTIRGVNPLNGTPFSATGHPGCLGGMLDVGFHYDLTDFLTLGTFLLFLSGETFSGDDTGDGRIARYTSFISVYSHITHTNLFFTGGMNENFSARTFSTSGVNGRGVLTPGLTAGVEITEDVTLRLVGAALFAHGAQLDSGSRFYGFETDLNFQWSLTRNLQLLLEADYFWTGPFFDFGKPLEEPVPTRRIYEEEPAAWKILVGIDLLL